MYYLKLDHMRVNNLNNDIKNKVVNEEKEMICRFINNFNDHKLMNTKDLFYRRVLSKNGTET